MMIIYSIALFLLLCFVAYVIFIIKDNDRLNAMADAERLRSEALKEEAQLQQEIKEKNAEIPTSDSVHDVIDFLRKRDERNKNN